MTENDIYATVRAEVGQFDEMIQKMSMKGDHSHSELYLNILDDRIEVLQSSQGEIVLSYGTFREDFFDDITLEKEVTKHQSEDTAGNQYSYEVGCEVLLDVERTSEYLGYASKGGIVELEFSGTEDRRLSKMLRAEGALETWINLASGGNIHEEVPHWLPNRFNENNQYTNAGGDPAPIEIQTTVDELDTIIEVVDSDPNVDFYPIVVKDERFRIDVGDSDRLGVRGILESRSVVGPDCENFYNDGFEEVFKVLDGSVVLQTAPDNNPMAVISESDASIVRHIIGTVNV